MGDALTDLTCRICMTDVSDATAVKGCSHTFCYHCIHQWTSTRRTPLCPICRTGITTLILADGTEQQAEPSTTAAQSEEPDLSCLDHNYFLGEVGRLLHRATSVQTRLYNEAYGCGRRGSRHKECILDAMQDLVASLTSYRSSLQEEVRYDPEVLLQDLYRLDRQLSSLQSGNLQSASAAAAGEAAADQQPWQEAGQQEHCHQESGHQDEYDDYDSLDDDWHEGLSKTPGRRPPHRNQRNGGRPGRSWGS